MNYFLDLDSDFELAVSESSQVLKEGGLVLLPTDTVYGVAAIPTNKSAVEAVSYTHLTLPTNREV